MFRRRLLMKLSTLGYRSLSQIGLLNPKSRPGKHGVEVIRNVAYLQGAGRGNFMDIYRPMELKGPCPVVLYVHGGAFSDMSKDTHWLMGLIFARRGFIVFNINYRLAPKYPFPDGLMDVCRAFSWVVDNARYHRGDLNQLVLAGESAGANLVTALSLGLCYRRPESWARMVWDKGVMPLAVMPACGMLQVSDPERFMRRKKLPWWVSDQLIAASELYLNRPPSEPSALDFADPLLFLEQGQPPDRPLPPFFAGVGTSDPLLEDTRRLKSALNQLGVDCEARYYQREIHAFHALIWRSQARQYWKDAFTFLQRLGVETRI